MRQDEVISLVYRQVLWLADELLHPVLTVHSS